MSDNPNLRQSEERKVSLLRSLRVMNSRGYYPRMSELVKFDDKRETIPRNTIVYRRRLIRNLLNRGLIAWTGDAAGHPVRLEVTHAGHMALTAMEK